MKDHASRFRDSLHVAIDSVQGVKMGMVQEERALGQFLRDAALNDWQPKELAIEAACRLVKWDQHTQIRLNFVICTAIVIFLDKTFARPIHQLDEEYSRRLTDLVAILQSESPRLEMPRWLDAWYG